MTKQMQVRLAVKALVQAALPAALVLGFDADASQPPTVGAGGCVIGDPGDPGEPELDLSPPVYNYEHEIPLDVAAANGVGGELLDAMIGAIGAAVAADRTLGGLCDYLDCRAATLGSREGQIATGINWASTAIVASYSTNNPLG